MQLLKAQLIGLGLCGLLFATFTDAQYIQTRGSYPIWKQFTPINVYHPDPIQQPIWQRFTPISVYHYRTYSSRPVSIATWHNNGHAQLLTETATTAGIAVPNHNAPAIPEAANLNPGSVATTASGTVDVINVDQLPADEVSVIEIPSAVVPAGNEESVAANQEEIVGGQQPDTKSKLKVGFPAAPQNEDPDAEKVRKLENDLVRKTEALEKVEQDRDKLKKLLEQQILNAINRKQDGEAAADKVERLIKENNELRALNKQLQELNEARTLEQQKLAKQLAISKEALAKAMSGKTSDAPYDGPKTLAELAEIKRKEREMQSSANAKPTAESLQAEMKSELTSAVETIRKRFQRKMEWAREQGDDSELIANLDEEMKLQIEKMKERIENRFMRRIESARQSNK